MNISLLEIFFNGAQFVWKREAFGLDPSTLDDFHAFGMR